MRISLMDVVVAYGTAYVVFTAMVVVMFVVAVRMWTIVFVVGRRLLGFVGRCLEKGKCQGVGARDCVVN
jgi:hypothetical protein